jgi:hypothetical protein
MQHGVVRQMIGKVATSRIAMSCHQLLTNFFKVS